MNQALGIVWMVAIVLLLIFVIKIASPEKPSNSNVVESKLDLQEPPAPSIPKQEIINGKTYIAKRVLEYVGFFDNSDTYFFQDSLGARNWYRIVKNQDTISAVLHRLSGPAVEHLDGYKEWWVFGEKQSKAEFNDLIKDFDLPLADDVVKTQHPARPEMPILL